MRERTLIGRVLRRLNGLGFCKAVKVHGSAFTEVGTPDIFGCYRGRAFLIEVKTPVGTTTKIQRRRQFEWQMAAAQVATISDLNDLEVFVRGLQSGAGGSVGGGAYRPKGAPEEDGEDWREGTWTAGKTC